MVTCAEFWSELSSPFAYDRVSWRVGATTADKKKGMALAYIDARDVMERLDTVLNPAGWQCDYPHAGVKTVCSLKCWLPMGAPHDDIENCSWDWIAKADGAGDTDYEAAKGALSDAFKRAAVRFGVGRYLYDLSTPWLEVEQRGKSFVFTDDSLTKLGQYLKKATPHGAGTNQERVALRVLCKALDYMSDEKAIQQFQTDKRADLAMLSIANREAFENYVRFKLKQDRPDDQ